MRSTEEKIKRKVISVVIIVAILSMMAGREEGEGAGNGHALACLWRADRVAVK